LLLLATSCNQEKLQSDNSIENLIYGKDTTLLQSYVEKPFYFHNAIFEIDEADNTIDWDGLTKDLSAITNEADFDNILEKRGLLAYPNFRYSALAYTDAKLKLMTNYGDILSSLNENNKQIFKDAYSGYYIDLLFAATSTIKDENQVTFRQCPFELCMVRCFNDGWDDALMCLIACIPPTPWGCLGTAACEIISARKMNRCYDGCRSEH